MERGKEIEDGEYEEYVWRRRQSSRMLQGMLKRVGHVPFHPIQEMDGAVGGAEETKALHPALSKMKPETFQTTASDSKHDLFQTTPSDSKYDIFKTTLSDSKHDLFQTTPSDSKHDLFQTTSSDSKHDLFQTTPSDSKHDLFQTAPSDSKHDLFQTTPSDSKYDIFKTAPSDSKHDLFQTAPSDSKYDIFKTAPSDSKHDLFQTIPSDSKHDLFQTTPSDSKYDIFKTAPSDSKYDLFQTTSSDSKHDLFQTTPSDSKYDLFQTTPSDPKHDLFQTTPSDSKYDIFKTAPSDSKHDFFQTTPSDSKNELFQTTPSDSKYDIFKTAPSDSKYDLFQTTPSDSKHDLFQTTPSDPKHDLFQTTPSNSKHDLFQTTPSDSKHDLFQTTPSDSKHDLFQTTHSDSKHDLFKTTPSDSKHDLFQTAPSDSKHDLFQAAPSDSKHDLFKTPLPKLKENGHITANGSRSPDLKSTRNKDHESWDSKEYPVYQNVFLIGEEKCVEDWPEDSPELCPDWKPPGRLRLRRESMKVLSGTRMEWGNQDPMENNAENNYKAKKSRRFTLPIPTRRQSKSEAELVQKGADLFKGRVGEEDEQDVAEEYRLQRQKRGKKFRITFLQRRDSKGATLPETPPGATCKNYHLSEAAESEAELVQKGADLFKGREGEEDEQDVAEEYRLQRQKRGKKFRITFLQRRDSKGATLPETPPGATCKNYHLSEAAESEAELVQKGADLFKGRVGEEDEQDVAEEYRLRQKRGKKFRITFLQRRDSKGATLPETPPGATCKNYHLSEAAEAEWLSAQRDESLVNGGKVEETGGMEDGDTDSLMEWWNTVEQWDELPSDDEDWVGDGEVKELKVLAEKVQKGIHVFNKVFMEQAEGLWQHIIDLNAIAENINEFHKKAKIASITGGTTSAVGGVTAIAGLALAPVTLGASLIITAVGIGVATAGGLTSASASISDSVHNSQDRKKVERIVEDYQTKMADISKCLRYVQQGLEKLLAYNLLKMDLAGEQGLGLSRAVQMASEASGASERAVQLSSQVSTVLTGLFQGMDDYYMDKDSRELKKGCKTEFAAKIREVANRLHEALVELNSIREELQDTVYNI
ncbi:uncharacterized protein LOC118232162 isoform X4 [Anguilla anguilla]|uniref:uncharacterized protein LOC118232162 isoform X4 n=1 Tax=Anguilla anguilla TaxID=7936 RepID=UPI0015ABF169|nr:uncharacterized protein LOC118232162 isoform X4 [Anguilla anguilla]